MPSRESQRTCPPTPPPAETTAYRGPKPSSEAPSGSPKGWLRYSREQSLLLPMHRLHRAPGALAGRRENLIRTDREAGPVKRLLATISLISVSINLHDTLETSEKEQSGPEKKEQTQAPEDRQCLGLVVGTWVSPGTLLPDRAGRQAQAPPNLPGSPCSGLGCFCQGQTQEHRVVQEKGQAQQALEQP